MSDAVRAVYTVDDALFDVAWVAGAERLRNYEGAVGGAVEGVLQRVRFGACSETVEGSAELARGVDWC